MNDVHVPPESVRTIRRRFLDWRFIAALTCLALVVLLCVGAWRNYEIRQAEVGQRDALIAQLHDRAEQIESLEAQLARMQDRIDGLHAKSRRDRLASRREQQVLLRQLARMLRLLEVHGIAAHDHPPGTPPVVRRSSPSGASQGSSSSPRPSSGGSGFGGTSSGTSGPRAKSQPKPKAPAAGKSGKTPSGKAKGLRRGKRH